MSDNDNKILRLMNELRRRRTFRVAAGYIVVGWVLIEVSSVVLPAFGAPEWTLPAIIITVVSGLPVALALSWIFDLTPQGLRRTDDLDREGAQEDAVEDIPAELKPSIAVPLGTAERRQVSILRCTFRLTANGNVVSDPELMMAAIPDLNALIENTAERFSAYLLDASGPVFELLFGYPTAFENDAVRAVSAAFAIRREASKLALGNDSGLPLQATCSASVHSDQVIIDDTENGQNAATVVGNSSLVAGWLQTLAPADVIGISEDTRVLLRNTIRCESLGEFVNPQTGETTEVHKAVQLISPKDALSAPASGQSGWSGGNPSWLWH